MLQEQPKKWKKDRKKKKKEEEEELALLGGERAMGDEALALFGELDASSSLS